MLTTAATRMLIMYIPNRCVHDTQVENAKPTIPVLGHGKNTKTHLASLLLLANFSWEINNGLLF
jgi:hypothetical protein